MLKHIAIGSALIHGRLEVNDEDLSLVRHIAASSGPGSRQTVFRAVLKCGGSGSTRELVDLTGLSHPTVRKAMEELSKLGLVTYTPGEATKGEPHQVELVGEYRQLVAGKLDQNPENEKGWEGKVAA
jgi:hypothetical protein